MLSYGRPMVRVSRAALAKVCGVSRSTVGLALDQLSAAGFVKPHVRHPNEEQESIEILCGYTAKAPKQKESKPLVAGLLCIMCGKRRKSLGKLDTCRTCLNEVKTRRIVREELAERMKGAE